MATKEKWVDGEEREEEKDRKKKKFRDGYILALLDPLLFWAWGLNL